MNDILFTMGDTEFFIFVLAISILIKLVFFTVNEDPEIILVYMDKNGKTISLQVIEHVSDDVYLQSGYKIYQYRFKTKQNILYLFLKHHTYLTTTIQERIRYFTFKHNKSVTVHENYKEDLS